MMAVAGQALTMRTTVQRRAGLLVRVGGVALALLGPGPGPAAPLGRTAALSPTPIVALGDSITWGYQGAGRPRALPWPSLLAARLGVPVANAGIRGNAVGAGVCTACGPAAPVRLGRDVLAVRGVRVVIILLGINDTWRGYPARRTMAGLALIARRLHARGLRVIGATLLPYGASVHWTPAGERTREQINAWIRRQSGRTFDGVIDFARAMADPRHPLRLRPALDCGDGLHPNAAGYQAMGSTVPVALLRAGDAGRAQFQP